MVCNSYAKAMLVNYPKKYPFKELTCTQLIFSLRILETFQNERIQLVDNSNSQFCQKISFGANGQVKSNLSQNYPTFYLMISSKNFFEMF